METILKDSLKDRLNLNNFISKNQHGFLSRHSTGLQLFECVNDWTQAIKNDKCVDICYIDFKRALFSFLIYKLIHKLKHIGISDH